MIGIGDGVLGINEVTEIVRFKGRGKLFFRACPEGFIAKFLVFGLVRANTFLPNTEFGLAR